MCQLPVYVTLKSPPASFFTYKGMLVYVRVFTCIRGLVCTLYYARQYNMHIQVIDWVLQGVAWGGGEDRLPIARESPGIWSRSGSLIHCRPVYIHVQCVMYEHCKHSLRCCQWLCHCYESDDVVSSAGICTKMHTLVPDWTPAWMVVGFFLVTVNPGDIQSWNLMYLVTQSNKA